MSERPSGPEPGKDDLFSAGVLGFDVGESRAELPEPSTEVDDQSLETEKELGGSTAVERLKARSAAMIAEVDARDEEVNSLVSEDQRNNTSDSILSTARTVGRKLAQEAAARDKYDLKVAEARKESSIERKARAEHTREVVAAAFGDRPHLPPAARETIADSKKRSEQRAKWDAIFSRMAGSETPDDETKAEWAILINSVPEAERIALELKLQKDRKAGVEENPAD